MLGTESGLTALKTGPCLLHYVFGASLHKRRQRDKDEGGREGHRDGWMDNGIQG